MSNERDELDRGGDGGEWTKEEPGQDKGFDFSAFLGPETLEEQVTDALDGKDLLDRDAYGTFPPGYIRRRGAPGDKGRHEAPEPDPEPEYPGDPPTQRFGRDGQADQDTPPVDPPAEERPPVIKDEPPPRPKVVVADPTPRVYVTPEREYDDEEPGAGKTGKGLKFAVALLLAVAVLLAGGLAVMHFLRPDGSEPSAPAPSPTDYLFGGMPTRKPTPPPTAPPTAPPTPTPGPTPPQIVFHTISVTAGTGGSISPSGAVSVEDGQSATFTITPDPGFTLIQLLVDGSNVQVANVYTFSDVREDHVIYAIFQAEATAPPAPTEPPAPTAPPAPTDAPVTEEPAPEQPDVPPQVEG